MSTPSNPDYQPFLEMRDRGATADEVFRNAKDQGLSLMVAIPMMRSLFGLSFQEFQEVKWRVEGHPLGVLASIRSHEELIAFLKQDMGYCGCAAYGAALFMLHGTLRIARDSADAIHTKADKAFALKRQELENFLAFETNPGLATWFLYLLDDKGLVEHAGNVRSCWITEKGRRLLAALERYGDQSQPQPPAEPAAGLST